MAEEVRLYAPGRLVLHARQDVTIDAEGHGGSRVPEALLDDLRVHPLTEQMGRVAVTEIVEPDARHPGALAHRPQVALGDVVAVERLPVLLTEDETVIGRIVAGGSQRLTKERRQGDGPPTPLGLRLLHRDCPPDAREAALD